MGGSRNLSRNHAATSQTVVLRCVSPLPTHTLCDVGAATSEGRYGRQCQLLQTAERAEQARRAVLPQSGQQAVWREDFPVCSGEASNFKCNPILKCTYKVPQGLEGICL